MGIPGLHSFIKDHKHRFGEEQILKNQHLVVDANNCHANLFATFALTNEHFRNDLLGGDICAFSKEVRKFFDKCEKCNLTLHLVFDGSVIGKPKNEADFAARTLTVMQRGKNRLNLLKSMTEFSDQTFNVIKSGLMKDAFKEIAVKRNIKCIQAPLQADTFIAKYANELNSLVLSNDSDFVLYDLNNGYVIQELFDDCCPVFDQASGERHIKTFVFSQKKFLQNIPELNKAKLPLLDCWTSRHKTLFSLRGVVPSPIHIPWRHRFLFNSTSKNQLALFGYIETLSRGHVQDALAFARRAFGNEVVEYTYNKFDMSEGHYKFESALMAHLQVLIDEGQISAESLQELVDNLTKLLAESCISSSAIDVLFGNIGHSHAIIGDIPVYTEKHILDHAIGVTLSLVKLKPYDKMSTTERQNYSSFTFFRMINPSLFDKITIEPIRTLKKFGSLDDITLLELYKLTKEQKQQIVLATFNVESLTSLKMTTSKFAAIFTCAQFCESMAMLFSLLKYVTEDCPFAIISEYFKLGLAASILIHASDKNCVRATLSSEIAIVVDSMKKIGTDSQKTNYCELMHLIAQLTRAMESFGLINGLLQHPFARIQVSEFFSGPTIVKLTRMFIDRKITIDAFKERCSDFVDLVYNL